VGRHRGDDPKLTPQFAVLRGLLGTRVYVTRPRDPETKGKVERTDVLASQVFDQLRRDVAEALHAAVRPLAGGNQSSGLAPVEDTPEDPVWSAELIGGSPRRHARSGWSPWSAGAAGWRYVAMEMTVGQLPVQVALEPAEHRQSAAVTEPHPLGVPQQRRAALKANPVAGGVRP
jgi:hypothetical protein